MKECRRWLIYRVRFQIVRINEKKKKGSYKPTEKTKMGCNTCLIKERVILFYFNHVKRELQNSKMDFTILILAPKKDKHVVSTRENKSQNLPMIKQSSFCTHNARDLTTMDRQLGKNSQQGGWREEGTRNP